MTFDHIKLLQQIWSAFYFRHVNTIFEHNARVEKGPLDTTAHLTRNLADPVTGVFDAEESFCI